MSARRARSRSRSSQHGDEHADERWLVSYSDMITVLMALFIVMFAISSVDQGKYEELRNALQTGFGTVDEGKIDTAAGVVVAADDVTQVTTGEPTNLELAVLEVAELRTLQGQIETALEEHGLLESVRVTLNERGLTIGLVTSEMFFEPVDAELTERAEQVLDVISPSVVASPFAVSVEGHADAITQTAPFPTNWELSAARATQVVRHLISSGGIAPERILAIGYGSSRPLAMGTDADALAMNRRVDIVVLSDAPDAVRAFIPHVLQSEPDV
ncbi:flagellar motor protein MotB [Pseudactinotalea terrae]|uniref:flagellar motor protein MotB n=1 Tax=Pseudactinotalea terrae TaxID=1743262 RepID=UPI0012E26F0E|nr:flagellar motor protein MotB [Pseudactinotalea terrae]